MTTTMLYYYWLTYSESAQKMGQAKVLVKHSVENLVTLSLLKVLEDLVKHSVENLVTLSLLRCGILISRHNMCFCTKTVLRMRQLAKKWIDWILSIATYYDCQLLKTYTVFLLTEKFTKFKWRNDLSKTLIPLTLTWKRFINYNFCETIPSREKKCGLSKLQSLSFFKENY